MQSDNYQVQQQKPSSYLLKYVQSQDEANLISVIKSSKSIGFADKDIYDSMIDTIAKWRWMAGVSHSNQDENELASELLLISKFIINNYPSLTIEEINLSIDLSLTNKLDVDVRTFNVFSPSYVSRIINAYLDYKKKLVHDVISRKVSAENKKEMDKKPSPEEQMKNMIELVEHFFNEYKEKKEINDHFNTCYNYFRRTNILTPNKETINEALEYGKLKASEHIEKHFINDYIYEKPSRDNVEKRFARNYCVQRFFDIFTIEEIKKRVLLNHFD